MFEQGCFIKHLLSFNQILAKFPRQCPFKITTETRELHDIEDLNLNYN